MASNRPDSHARPDASARRYGAPHSTGLTIVDTLRMTGKHLPRLLAFVLIAAVLGGALGVAYGYVKETPEVTAVISFAYNGVEQGLDPAGAVLDIDKLRSKEILADALSASSLAESVKSAVDLDRVRAAIHIDGVVPKDVMGRLTAVTTVATSERALSSTETAKDEQYFPTQFELVLRYQEAALSKEDAIALLNAVLDAYRAYFYQSYANTQLLSVAVGGIDYEDYDYSEALRILSSQISIIQSYVESLNERERAKDFRSSETGYSFSDILAELSVVADVDLTLADSIVYSYGTTRDTDMMVTYLNYQLETKMRELDVAQEVQNAVDKQLSQYEKDTVMVFGSGDATQSEQMSMSMASEEYDKLIARQISSSTSVASIEAEIERLQMRIANLSLYDETQSGAAATEGGNAGEADDTASAPDLAANVITVEEYEARCIEVDADIASISKKLHALVTVTEDTAREFFDTLLFSNAYLVKLSACDQHNVLKSMIKYGLVGGVAAGGIGLVFFFAWLCLHQAKAYKNKATGRERVKNDVRAMEAENGGLA